MQKYYQTEKKKNTSADNRGHKIQMINWLISYWDSATRMPRLSWLTHRSLGWTYFVWLNFASLIKRLYGCISKMGFSFCNFTVFTLDDASKKSFWMFDTCIQCIDLWNHLNHEDIKIWNGCINPRIPLCILSITSPPYIHTHWPPGNYWCAFSYHRLVSFFLYCHIIGIFCFWLLSTGTMFSSFFHVVVCTSNLFL